VHYLTKIVIQRAGLCLYMQTTLRIH